MQKYLIRGGRKLEGCIEAQSAKNSVLALIAGALLTDEEVVIENCPKITDVINMLRILSHLGVENKFENDNLIINAKTRNNYLVPEYLSKQIRTSVYFLGALIGICDKVVLGRTGGCDIGERPIDIHLDALSKLGVSFRYEESFLHCEKNKKILGASIDLRLPSVGATVNTILASVFNDCVVRLSNCAKEPEIVDLCNFLNSMGAKISGMGSNQIVIEGVRKLRGTRYRPIPDRIEIGTYILAVAITGGNLQLKNTKIENIKCLLDKISNNTCSIAYKNDIIHIKKIGLGSCFDFRTAPFPGYPTDLQAQTMALLAVSRGQSIVIEDMFDKRFAHVPYLCKMGANIKVFENVAVINGVKKLTGCSVKACDLRGGASLVLAGLYAEGQTLITDIEHVERGYYNFSEKLSKLGADIKKID